MSFLLVSRLIINGLSSVVKGNSVNSFPGLKPSNASIFFLLRVIRPWSVFVVDKLKLNHHL